MSGIWIEIVLLHVFCWYTWMRPYRQQKMPMGIATSRATSICLSQSQKLYSEIRYTMADYFSYLHSYGVSWFFCWAAEALASASQCSATSLPAMFRLSGTHTKAVSVVFPLIFGNNVPPVLIGRLANWVTKLRFYYRLSVPPFVQNACTKSRSRSELSVRMVRIRLQAKTDIYAVLLRSFLKCSTPK